MPAEHSLYSASRFDADMACPGRRTMEAGRKSPASIYAAKGTVAHSVLECAIKDGMDPRSFVGQMFKQDGFAIEFDEALCENVESAVKNIREMTAGYDVLEAESRVNYAVWLDVEESEAWGTADIKGVKGHVMDVHDFKNGHKPVPADCAQLKLYGGGTLLEYEGIADIDTVRLVIHQPEVSDKPIVHFMPAVALKAWLIEVARPAVKMMKEAAWQRGKLTQEEWEAAYLHAGADQCKYCAASFDCAVRRKSSLEGVFQTVPASADEFASTPVGKVSANDSDEWLAAAMAKADEIEDYLTAVRAEVERRLLNGKQVAGFKIVQGKRGNRAWVDPAEAEATMKTMRLKIEEMYNFKLISPTAAEKLAKAGTIGKRQWPKLQAMIGQADGKAHVASVDDPRPAVGVKPVAEHFEDVSDMSDIA